jgi:hypothetical protein
MAVLPQAINVPAIPEDFPYIVKPSPILCPISENLSFCSSFFASDCGEAFPGNEPEIFYPMKFSALMIPRTSSRVILSGITLL